MIPPLTLESRAVKVSWVFMIVMISSAAQIPRLLHGVLRGDEGERGRWPPWWESELEPETMSQ